MSDEQNKPAPLESPTQKSASTRRAQQRRAGQLSGVQVMFAAILAIGMVLGINFSNRIASSQPLRTYYEGMETEIAELRQEQADLIGERNFVESDAFVEQWARSDGKMVRPGEVLVIPQPAGAPEDAAPTATPPPAVEVETTAPDPDPWELWWALFFDSPPPEF